MAARAQEFPDLRDFYQRRFQFILVDEYQDTNSLQGELIDRLAAVHKNVMVVGDDAQSIYAWRGANFKNILEFPQRYFGCQTFKIEVNYRSTPEILAFANAAIAPNIHQFQKALAPARPSGMKPVVVACMDAGEQASFVAQRALELRDEGIPLNEMAVLYRSHFHALELQFELTRRNIPFSITSGIRFFEQAHVKDVAAYLKLVHNPHDEISFKRLARMMPGVGGKSADKLWQKFNGEWRMANSESVTADGSRAIHHSPFAISSLAASLARCAAAVPKKTTVAWAQFTATIAQLCAPELRAKTDAMIRLVLEAGYGDYLKATYTNFRNRLEDLSSSPPSRASSRPSRTSSPSSRCSRTSRPRTTNRVRMTTRSFASRPFIRPRASSSASSSSSCFAMDCFLPRARWIHPRARRKSAASSTWPSRARRTNST